MLGNLAYLHNFIIEEIIFIYKHTYIHTYTLIHRHIYKVIEDYT